MKKVNPRKRPATQADVIRAKKQAVSQAVNISWAIMFTCLRDKEGWGHVRLSRLWGHIQNLCDSVNRGYVSVDDLLRTLEEDGIELKGDDDIV